MSSPPRPSSAANPASAAVDTNAGANDLDWLALQYLLGEFSPEATAEWELRLADDLPAAEALARAVILLESLPATLPTAVVQPLRRTHFHFSRFLWPATLAAGLLLVVGWNWQSVFTPAAPQPAELLVSYWRTAPAWNDQDLDWLPDANEPDNGEGAVLNEAGVPNWMMLAVSADKTL